jgi:hypothetical protein
VGSGVDVHRRVAQETDQGEARLLGQVDGERGRRGDGGEQRDARQDGLLDQLERGGVLSP